MSSESEYIAWLKVTQVNLYKFGGLILMIIGTVSCVLNLMTFTKKNLRKNPCSIYFIAYNTGSLVMIYIAILPQTLSFGYLIDPASYNVAFCRVSRYALLLCDIVGPSYLLLCSVDRVLLTSRNALIRQYSTLRLAYISIFSVTLFWLLAHSHTLFLVNIQSVTPSVIICLYQVGSYYTFVRNFTIIVKGSLLPLLLLILGLWAIKNVQGMSRVAHAAVSVVVATSNRSVGLRANHSKDRQLLRILLADVSIYLIFNLMLSVLFIYQQIAPPWSNTVQNQLQVLLVGVGTFSSFIPSCIGFYVNLLVSRTFRCEAKNALMFK